MTNGDAGRGTGGGHVSVDQLADLAAGVAAPADAADIESHVSRCTTCQDRRAALVAVSDALADAPRPELPLGVASRIDAALLTAAGSTPTVVPLDGGGRDRRGGRWAGLGAVAAAVALVGALIAAHVVGGKTGPSGGATATAAGNQSTADRPASPAQLQTLEHVVSPGYTKADLVSRVSRQLQTGSPSATRHLPTTAGSEQSAGAATALGASRQAPRALTPLQAPARLSACISQLDIGSSAPLAIDYTTYDGKPAVVVVVPDQYAATKAVAYVVGPRCGLPGSDGDLIIYEGAIPR